MGKLFLVSTGPGDKGFMTQNAIEAIRQSTELVAYGLYLEYLGPLIADKKLHALPLGQETERVKRALDLAASGRTTALLSSGDIGIYAMATRVFELLHEVKKFSVDIEVIPGVSAIQAASSRLGALLGQDFCTISLSDLLTPWKAIEKRVQSAAESDFVIAFYNPKSEQRHWQLSKAKEILINARSVDTPVVLCKQLTREDEQITWTTLGGLDINQVDLLTLVCIGNSQTKIMSLKNKKWIYTPRLYLEKSHM